MKPFQAQNLMREQMHNVKSVNLVSELCTFLSLIYSNVDGEYIDIICEILETIIQFIQGNCQNQGVVFDCKVREILAMSSLYNNIFFKFRCLTF